MGTGDPAHSVVARSLTCLKLETHSCQGITGDHPGINLPQDVYKHVAQAHGVQVHLHEAQAAFRSKRSCTDNLFVLTRILQEAGKANKTVYVLSGRAQSV
jgi:hypothetical protein